MTNEQAILIINNVLESLSLSYKDHVVLKQALEVLTVNEIVPNPEEEVTTPEEETTPKKNKK